MTETQCAAASLDPKDQRIKDLEHEVDMLTNAGVIECAVRNKSVAEYIEHWEGRATKAEQALALRGEPVAGIVVPYEPTDEMIKAGGEAKWIPARPDPIYGYEVREVYQAMLEAAPLYAAPISGERDE